MIRTYQMWAGAERAAELATKLEKEKVRIQLRHHYAKYEKDRA